LCLPGNFPITHPKFRQAHLAPYKRLITRVRQAGNNGGAHAGSGRLTLGRSLARAEAWTVFTNRHQQKLVEDVFTNPLE
jgi:hypothetical protein